MAKRKRKEAPAPETVNGAGKSFVERMQEDSRKLRELRTACGHLDRVKTVQPKHIEKFVERVFAIAGVQQEAAPAAPSGEGL